MAGRHASLLLVAPALLFLALTFLWPLARIVVLSFGDPRGSFGAYHELLGDDVYRRVFTNTVIFALVVTAIAIVLGYAIAYTLARLGSVWRGLLFAAVLMPLWISVLVRTFSWMLLLERNGPINRTLVASGLIDAPLKLLFNHTGVLIGMVHVLLPYAVLPIYAALARIDPALARASAGLGASAATTFARVTLPLSLQGVATAATFVFLLSLGFFITPAILGGASSLTLSMLIDGFINERLVWPLAAAAAVILLAATLVFLALAGRFVTTATIAETR